MKTIHKFRVDHGKQVTRLQLKSGFRIVRCEYLVPDKGVYLWVEQPLNVGKPNVERQFVVAFSGEPVPDSYQYLGTALDSFGPEAYHVFEVPPKQTAAMPELKGEDDTVPALPGHTGYQQVGAG